MTMLLLYPYWVGTVSSRKIKLACCEYLPVREITGDQQPDHSRNSDFRRRNREGLKILFVQILRLCRKAGLVIVGEVVLGGTKMKCNASKHKALTPSARKDGASPFRPLFHQGA